MQVSICSQWDSFCVQFRKVSQLYPGSGSALFLLLVGCWLVWTKKKANNIRLELFKTHVQEIRLDVSSMRFPRSLCSCQLSLKRSHLSAKIQMFYDMLFLNLFFFQTCCLKKSCSVRARMRRRHRVIGCRGQRDIWADTYQGVIPSDLIHNS